MIIRKFCSHDTVVDAVVSEHMVREASPLRGASWSRRTRSTQSGHLGEPGPAWRVAGGFHQSDDEASSTRTGSIWWWSFINTYRVNV